MPFNQNRLNQGFQKVPQYTKKVHTGTSFVSAMLAGMYRYILRHRRAQVLASSLVCVLISVLYLNVLR